MLITVGWCWWVLNILPTSAVFWITLNPFLLNRHSYVEGSKRLSELYWIFFSIQIMAFYSFISYYIISISVFTHGSSSPWHTQIAKSMGPTWGPPGSCQVCQGLIQILQIYVISILPLHIYITEAYKHIKVHTEMYESTCYCVILDAKYDYLTGWRRWQLSPWYIRKIL